MYMLPKRFFSYLVTLGYSISVSMASPLKSDEYVMFLPDIAYHTESQQLAVVVQAWVYEKERRPGMTTALSKYLGIDTNQLTPEQQARLYARTQLFRVDSERNKLIKIQFNDQSTHSLSKTNKEGRTTGIIKLAPTPALVTNNIIHYKLFQSGDPAGFNEGTAIFIPQTGVSVISDIDDTIKNSQVTDKKQLLINTFINEFKPIKEMSTWYNQLANSNDHVAFHYVSSSPIQLYPALREFMDSAQFPLGSYHLREGTSWNHLIAGDGVSETHKKSQIERLIQTFPKRQFILVGDSGEADPEIYADIMRRYPKQIRFIAIRNVTQEDNQAPRYQQTFKGIDSTQWTTFTEKTPTVSVE